MNCEKGCFYIPLLEYKDSFYNLLKGHKSSLETRNLAPVEGRETEREKDESKHLLHSVVRSSWGVAGAAGTPGLRWLWCHLSQGGLEPSLLFTALALGWDSVPLFHKCRALPGEGGVGLNELTSSLSFFSPVFCE